MRVLASVTKQDDWFVARCLEIELASQGRTQDEALDNLREALELRFEDEPAPRALAAVVTTVEFAISARAAA